jgi:hypothetical protein
MSPYERRRWAELEQHWAKPDRRRQIVPVKVRQALTTGGGHLADAGGRAAQRAAAAAPEPVKNAASSAVDGALAPTAKALVHLLELVTDWSVELTDPERVLEHHRAQGRDVASLEDLRELDLELLDEATRKLPLRWRSLGAVEGGAVGALAFIPVGGGLAAITLDVLVVHVLSTSIATRAAHAYGFDPSSPQTERMIDRMVQRAYSEQAAKVATQSKAGSAFSAAAGRQRWSTKLREDHRLLAAVEKLMKQARGGAYVPVSKAAKALPGIAVIMGAGTNSHVLSDVANQSIRYAQTVRLSESTGGLCPPTAGPRSRRSRRRLSRAPTCAAGAAPVQWMQRACTRTPHGGHRAEGGLRSHLRGRAFSDGAAWGVDVHQVLPDHGAASTTSRSSTEIVIGAFVTVLER